MQRQLVRNILLRHTQALLTASTIFLLSPAIVAQDDPFGSTQSDTDPFASSPKQNSEVVKYRDESEIAVERPESAEEWADQVRFLKSVIKDARHEINVLSVLNSDLKEKFNQQAERLANRDSGDEHMLKAYMVLLNKLLKSTSVDEQLIALRHVVDAPLLSVETGGGYFADHQAIMNIRRLVDSDNDKVKGAAIRDLIALQPSMAAELGYQSTGMWKPITYLPHENEKIRRAMQMPVEWDFDEVPLFEIIEEIAQSHNFTMILHEEISDEKAITIDVHGQSLGHAIERLADQLGLVVCVPDEVVMLLPKEHAKVRSTLSYNVHGLIDDTTSLEQIKKHAEESLGDGSKAWTMGKAKLFIKATFAEQNEVGKSLGMLSPYKR